jgi:hypothetical protein
LAFGMYSTFDPTIGTDQLLWGLIADRLHIRLFPVGYWLWAGRPPRPAGWRALPLPRRGRPAGPGGTSGADDTGGLAATGGPASTGGPAATGGAAVADGAGSPGGAVSAEHADTPGPGGTGGQPG